MTRCPARPWAHMMKSVGIRRRCDRLRFGGVTGGHRIGAFQPCALGPLDSVKQPTQRRLLSVCAVAQKRGARIDRTFTSRPGPACGVLRAFGILRTRNNRDYRQKGRGLRAEVRGPRDEVSGPRFRGEGRGLRRKIKGGLQRRGARGGGKWGMGNGERGKIRPGAECWGYDRDETKAHLPTRLNSLRGSPLPEDNARETPRGPDLPFLCRARTMCDTRVGRASQLADILIAAFNSWYGTLAERQAKTCTREFY